MNKNYHKKPEKQLKIAKARIDFLFRQAKEVFKEDSKLADKYVKMARRIAMKYKLRLSSLQKRQVCKNCRRFLVPGANARVRLHKHRMIYYCLSCGHYMRHPVK